MVERQLKIIARLLERREYDKALKFVHFLWDEDAWRLLKKNGNAVRRVKAHFEKLAGAPAYTSNAKFWDQKLARWVEVLGVAALIDDISLAVPKFRPRSLVYFLYNDSGACRFEMLHMARIQADWQDVKLKEAKDYEALAQRLGLGDLFAAEKRDPEWVAPARARLKSLQGGSLSGPQVNEMMAIEARLRNAGFLENKPP